MNRRFCVLGVTGTLGSEIVRQLYESEHDIEVVGISRDELKQKQLKQRFPRLQTIIADIRDQEAMCMHLDNFDAVFHTAAYKHVDVLEHNPEEALKTNTLGTVNVANSCIKNYIPFCVFFTTDKAVASINAYGQSKALAEKILLQKNRSQCITRFKLYRWGNVSGSRGSAYHSFLHTLQTERKAFITNMEMTRFWITIEDAVRFMLTTYRTASDTEAMLPRMKAAKVTDFVKAIAMKHGIQDYSLELVGMRPGEKIHEDIRYLEEIQETISSDVYETYTIEELIGLLP